MDMMEPSKAHSWGRRKTRRTRTTATSSSSPIDCLPDGLLLEIFQHLPCKSATRSKCVSKRWFALISDPYFLATFLRRQTLKQPNSADFSLIYGYYEPDEVYEINLIPFSLNTFLPDWLKPLHMIGSFNDLLLCCDTMTYQTDYYICNPVTKQRVPLPPIPQSDLVVGAWLICDPYYMFKQGELVLNTKYKFKVVRIPEFDHPSTELEMEIFCSETGGWSESVVSCPRSDWSLLKSSAFVYNGMLHWWSGDGMVVCNPYGEGQCRFVAGLTDLSPPVNTNANWTSMGVCRGHVRLANWSINNGQRLIVWELKDYDAGKWCLEHDVYLDQMTLEISEWLLEYLKSAKFVAFHPDDGDTIYLRYCYCIVECNLKTRMFNVIGNIPPDCSLVALLLVHPWWPTPLPTISKE